MKSISLRAYGRHRGVSLKAVQAARDSGRLSKSLTADGRIKSAAAADDEWAATTHEDRRPITGPAASTTALPTLQAARTRKEAALAERAEIELANLKGSYVPVELIAARWIGIVTVCKTKLLGVPSKARQRDPSL